MKIYICKNNLIVGATYKGSSFKPFVWTGEGFLCQACSGAFKRGDFHFYNYCTRYWTFLPYELVEYPDTLIGALYQLRDVVRKFRAAVKAAVKSVLTKEFPW